MTPKQLKERTFFALSRAPTRARILVFGPLVPTVPAARDICHAVVSGEFGRCLYFAGGQLQFRDAADAGAAWNLSVVLVRLDRVQTLI
jgi:hypothetical protein